MERQQIDRRVGDARAREISQHIKLSQSDAGDATQDISYEFVQHDQFSLRQRSNEICPVNLVRLR